MTTIRSKRFILKIQTDNLNPKATKFWNFEKIPEIKRELPLNTVMIQNLSMNLIECKYSDVDIYIGGGKTWYDPQAFGTRTLEIINLEEKPNNNVICITISRNIDSDSCIISEYTNQNLIEIANGTGNV